MYSYDRRASDPADKLLKYLDSWGRVDVYDPAIGNFNIRRKYNPDGYNAYGAYKGRKKLAEPSGTMSPDQIHDWLSKLQPINVRVIANDFEAQLKSLFPGHAIVETSPRALTVEVAQGPDPASPGFRFTLSDDDWPQVATVTADKSWKARWPKGLRFNQKIGQLSIVLPKLLKWLERNRSKFGV